MRIRSISRRGTVTVTALVVLVAAVALPVLAADPTPSPTRGGPAVPVVPAAEPTPTATPTPTASPTPDDAAKPDKPTKPDKVPAVAVTATGTVGTRTDAEGRIEYTLTSGSIVRVLSAGPPWFWGDDHPLQPYLGKQVTVVGTSRAADEIDVDTVDGTELREPGRPPWAGGWKVVGEGHPGWSQDKADRWKAKRTEQMERHGVDCWPPGHCKDATSDSPDD